MSGLFFEHALLPDGWAKNVRTSFDPNGMFADVLPDAAPEIGDERHFAAVPGMPNVHSHAFQRGMAGLAEIRGPGHDNFWTWRETMYRFVARMTPDDMEAIATLAYVEMLEAGFTRVGEFHYLHHTPEGTPYANISEMAGRIVAAAGATGIGLTLMPVFYAHSNFGGLPPSSGQLPFVCSLDQYGKLLQRSRELIANISGMRLGVAPHSLRAVTPKELAEVIALAGDGPIHIHVAEQTKEVNDCLAYHNQRPVQFLLEHAAVDPRWCLIHATHMTTDETRDVARSGAVAGLCPITEANLGDGIFNGPEYVESQGRYAIGTDSNIQIGVAAELRQLEYAQRLGKRARNVMAGNSGSTGQSLFDTSLRGGGQALGETVIGLAKGGPGDIVTLNRHDPTLIGRGIESLLDSWLFCGGKEVIDNVWSGGRQVVFNGRHVARETIARRFRDTLAKII